MIDITKGYVDTSLGQIHYRTCGEDLGGTPIVMLHQTASSSEMFEALMQELGDEYHIVALDTPGFGGSFRPKEKGNIPMWTRALLEALDGLSIERCWLFGHHTGATIAVEMTHERPALPLKMALSGPCLLTQEFAAELAEKTRPLELKQDGSHFAEVWERIQGKDPDAPLALKFREAVLTLVAGTRWSEGYHAVFEHWAAFAEYLPQVEAETLVFAGTKDTVYGLLEPSYRALKNGSKATIEGQTTYSCDRAPGEVANLLRDHFQ